MILRHFIFLILCIFSRLNAAETISSNAAEGGPSPEFAYNFRTLNKPRDMAAMNWVRVLELERSKAEYLALPEAFEGFSREISATIGGKYGISSRLATPEEQAEMTFSISRTRHKFKDTKNMLPTFYGVSAVDGLLPHHQAHLAAVLTIDVMAAEAFSNAEGLNKLTKEGIVQTVNQRVAAYIKSTVSNWVSQPLSSTLEPTINKLLQDSALITLSFDVINIFAPNFTLENLHPTKTPFALAGAFFDGGLNALERIGWQGELSTMFRVAVITVPCVFTPVNPTKEVTPLCTFHTINIMDIIHPAEQTPWKRRILRDLVCNTNYSKVPVKFWENLVSTSNVDAFLRSVFLYDINVAKWDAIVEGLTTTGVDENKLYAEYRDAILEMFHRRAIIFEAVHHEFSTRMPKEFAISILKKLLKIYGKQAIIDHLNTFEGKIGADITPDDADGYSFPAALYYVFKEVGLIDSNWRNFFCFFPWFSSVTAEKQLAAIIDITRDGYCVGPYELWHNLNQLPFERVSHYLKEPILADLVVGVYEDYIEKNDKFSSQEKKVLHRQLYNVAFQRQKLHYIPIIPAEFSEWFAELPADGRLAVLKQTFNDNKFGFLNFPIIYGDPDSIDMVRRELFPTEAQAIQFVLGRIFPPNRLNMEWLHKLLQPYLANAFKEALKDSDDMIPPQPGIAVRLSSLKMTIFPAILFTLSGMQMPDDYSVKSLEESVNAMGNFSFFVLPPAQIVEALKNEDLHWHLRHFNDEYRDLLTKRLRVVQNTVKAGLAQDRVSRYKIRESTFCRWADEPMKSFLEFVSAD